MTSPTMFAVCLVHVVVSLVAIHATLRLRSRLGCWLSLMLAAGCMWSVLHAAELTASSLRSKQILDTLQNIPAGLISWFVLQVGNAHRGRRPGVWSWIAIGCILVDAVVLTALPFIPGGRNHLRLEGTPPTLLYDFGTWDIILALTSLAASFAAAITVLSGIPDTTKRKQTIALALGLGMPALGLMFTMSFGLRLENDRDLSSLWMIVSAGLVGWASSRPFDIVALAREDVLLRIPDPVLVFDQRKRLVVVNPAAVTLFGVESSQLGQVASRVFGAAPELASRLETMTGCELELSVAGRWSSVVVAPIFVSGRLVARSVIIRDITHYRNVREALTERVAEQSAALSLSEGRFRALFDEIISLMGILDREGRLLMANRPSLAMIGATEQEVIGRFFVDTPWWAHSPDAREQLRAAIERGARGENSRFQTSHIDSEGRRREIDFSLTVVKNHAGEVVQLIPEGRDVTPLAEERKRSERLAEQLRVSQRLEALGRLAGGVAHDFNNLLTVIRGNADVLAEHGDEVPVLKEPVAEIIEATDAATQITRQLLAFGRADQHGGAQTANLPEVLDTTRRMLLRLLRADVTLEIEAASDLHVALSPPALQQVLLNLALNAKDAMPNGGLLRFTSEEVELGAQTAEELGGKPGCYVKLVVTDTGMGIPEDVRSRIFEPFFSTKPETKGTGLGLAVVHGTIMQAGGIIDVQSETGVGTSFSLYLPRAHPAPVVVAPREHAAKPRSDKRGTIVLVEDQDALRTLLARSLVRQGYTLHTFGSPMELVNAAAELSPPPDLILTDVIMPGFTGVELIERVAPLWPDVRVLFMSGYVGDSSIRMLNAVSDDQLIAKPFRAKTLVERIEHVLDTSRPWSEAS